VSAGHFAAYWLLGVGVGSLALTAAHGNLGGLALPLFFGATGLLLLMRSKQRLLRFPATDLERGLDRLFALLLPAGEASTVTARVALAQELRRAGLRRAARHWHKELQVITTDGYEAASRISERCAVTGELDDEALAAEAVEVLSAERARAGVDARLDNDPVSILAYGLGVRPTGADLTSLDDLLRDLGLAGEDDELRTHFDDVVAAESGNDGLQLGNGRRRSMFRELAGASFVLGASARILELSSRLPARDQRMRAAAR
jgi:hypothetical protein